PARPTAKLRNKPKPLRSHVVSSPARLPPSRPTMIQTINWSIEGIVLLWVSHVLSTVKGDLPEGYHFPMLARHEKLEGEVDTNDHGKHENRWPCPPFSTGSYPMAGHSKHSCRRHRIFLEPDTARACTGSDLYCMRHRARRFLLWLKACICPF